jgi:hypothetical protein
MPLQINAYTTVNANSGVFVPMASSVLNRRIFIQPNADIIVANNVNGTGTTIRLAGGALARYDLGVTDPSTFFVRSNGGSSTNMSVYSFDAGES